MPDKKVENLFKPNSENNIYELIPKIKHDNKIQELINKQQSIEQEEQIDKDDIIDILSNEISTEVDREINRESKIDPEFLEWQKTKDPHCLSLLLKKYNKLIEKELPKYRGQLPDPILRTYAKKITVDAIKTFNPSKSKLSTHIVNNMLRMHRKNYEISGVARLPEDIQRGVNVFKNAKDYLIDKLNREPTVEELADELSWNKDRVIRLMKMAKKEVLSSSLDFAPARYEMSDPRLDYLYYDLEPKDKIVFQYKVGYRGFPVLDNQSIAKKINASQAMVSIRSKKIAEKINDILNQK